MNHIPVILLASGVFMLGLGVLIMACRRSDRTLNRDLFQK